MVFSSPAFSGLGGGLPEREVDIINHVVRDFLATRERQPDLELEDLVQESLLHWWTQRPKYNPQRGASIETFLRRVVKAKLTDIERVVRAQKRGGGRPAASLDQPISDDQAESDTLGNVLAGSADTAREATSRLSIHQALSRLTPRQRELISGLNAGLPMSQVSQALNVPRPTLYDELKRIRQVFRDEGLSPFLD